MSVSGDVQPNYTSIAGFVAKMHEQIELNFTQVLMICDEENLIGHNMFAIDAGGPARCKIKSNASKEWSGTFEELGRKKARLERASKRIVERHQAQDGLNDELVVHDVKQKKHWIKAPKKLQNTEPLTKKKRAVRASQLKVILLIPTARK
jgi:hypothetical protein